jgi:hypothetical protein
MIMSYIYLVLASYFPVINLLFRDVNVDIYD